MTGPAGLTPLQKAFMALEEARARVASLEEAATEPIAVIGLGCRVPGGGNDSASYWALLRDGVDAIGPLPADRWDVEATYDPDPDTPGRIAALGGGFLDDIRGFDPAAFGIARREAQGMDPQQRLLLEVAWEALEHAGQRPDRLERTRTGVYVGVAGSDYAYLQLETRDRDRLDAHFASGIAHSIVSGRLSYLLGLQGPALTIDTACSSSLVAVHLACQALRAGDCAMAVAGGVNLILSSDLYVALSRSRMLAPDGRCKTFDAAADGFARAEGCGVVVLKRLRAALADGDRVLALIRGSAVNQDGPSSGLTAPNGPAQEAVIREALSRARVKPGEVGYIEAHGTGTQLGDPLEVAALGAVFGPERDPARPLLIGSVKTNIGHLEAAAGVAGLIKLVLSLRAREIPAHLHFNEPSPHIPWDEFPVEVPTRRVPWAPIGGRRLAGVSSFGFSGTNVHIVVEEAPETAPAPSGTGAGVPLFVLSGQTAPALASMAARYADAFEGLGDERLADLCFTASAGRAHFPHRAAIAAPSIDDLRRRLRGLAEGRAEDGVRVSRVVRRDPARLAFLFTGQGAQYPGMAVRLDDTQPVFRAALDRCAAVLDAKLPGGLRAALRAPAASSLLDQTGHTQPVLFAVEYALTQLWRAWGVEPDVVIGHSVGEYVAAVVAGVLSVEDALAVVAERGRLMQSLPAGGAMAAIFAREEEVASALGPWAAEASVAAQNGPVQTVVAGTEAAVEALCALFTGRGVRCQRLPVSHAFHSPLVEPILDEFQRSLEGITMAKPSRRMISNLTGALADAADVVRPAYWRRHVRDAVRFADGMRTLAGLRPDVCLEVGPHPTLLAFAGATLDEVPEEDRPVLVGSLRKGRNDDEQLAEALGSLYLAGVDLDWRAVWQASGARLVDLPTYAFQREPLWFPESAASPVVSPGKDTGHPLLGRKLRSAIADTTQFEVVLRPDSQPFLADHLVGGSPILPGTALLEMARAAGQSVLACPVDVRDMIILAPLRFQEDESRVVQVVVQSDADGAGCRIFSAGSTGDEEQWQQHAECRVRRLTAAATVENVAAVRARCVHERSAEEHYADLGARGLVFGPSLRGVQNIRCAAAEALAEIQLPEPGIAGHGTYGCHPALLDACIQALSAALSVDRSSGSTEGRAYLPLAIESCQILRPSNGLVFSHASVAGTPGQSGSDTLVGNVTAYDADGPFACVRGIALRPAPSGDGTTPDGLVEVVWEKLAPDDAGWVPAPAAVRDACAGRLESLAAEHDLAGYHAAFVDLERLATDWVLAGFHELGWRPNAGEVVDDTELASRLGVAPRYRRLVSRLLDLLAEDGWLEGTSRRIVARPLGAPSQTELADRFRRLRAQHGSSSARFDLANRCGPHLAGILRGDIDPLHRLFPDGSAELAESLYRDAPEARAYNQLLRDAVSAMVAALPAGRALRILEVGGGTGGTTAWVAPVLPADRTEYVFTDIGPSMVSRARQKFAGHAFMSFQTLDLDQPLAAQGLAGRRFDLVLAANVIHATADLRHTLEVVHGMLAPGGSLVMLEVAGFERWIDITFGLTDGWWRFTDTTLRPAYPLLGIRAWLDLLNETGFDADAIASPDGRSREALLAARSRDRATGRPGRWLLVGGGDTAAALADELRAAGHDPSILAADETAIRQLVRQASGGIRGVVHLAGLDVPAPDGTDSLLPDQRASLGSLVAVVQALGSSSHALDGAPQVCVITQGAVAVNGDGAPAVAQSPLVALARVVAMEHPELGGRRIDLDPGLPAAEQARTLATLILGDDAEDQVAVRGGDRFAARLAEGRLEPGAGPVRLMKGPGGVFDELHFAPAPRRGPGPGEVEIRVVAGGLNFRDVMNAVAMRDDPEPLGGECAGRVSAVGEGVTDLTVGDHVVAIAEASFASYATTGARFVRPVPAGLTFAQAATLPFAFMTARYALHDCGGLRAGESVLIHAGAGGVGMAAIQLARAAGATVYATAGSPRKRAFLASLGVAHVFDSRSVNFAEEITRVTGGRGVDVVLNSLAGEFIAASVGCLSPSGRFLEIGKRDIWTPEQFAEVRPAGRYFAIDLAVMRVKDPAGSAALFGQVIDDAGRGLLRPLPVCAFPMARAADAFRFMAQGKHTGKVVLVQRDAVAESLASLDPRGSYLVTGGLTGLGLLTARRLVARGARHLTLVGRRAPAAEACEVLDEMRAAGVTVVVEQADVSRPDEVRRVLGRIPAAAPLRGVVHSAGVLNDGGLLQHSWESFVGPLGPKVDGTWALHQATLPARLDFFVLYSSMASMIGSAGQGNHAAANAFMDALAAARAASGEPGLSISWGPWSEVGAAAERRVDTRTAEQGIEAIRPVAGMDTLERLMGSTVAHVGVFPVRWAEFLARPEAASPLLAGLRRAARRPAAVGAAVRAEPSPPEDFSARYREANAGRRRDLLLGLVGDQVAKVIGAPDAAAIDPRQPLNELGLDSLMAVELRNRLGTRLGLARSLPATMVFDHPTLEALVRYLETDVMAVAGGAETAPAPAPEKHDAVLALDDLSDEAIDALFAKRVQGG